MTLKRKLVLSTPRQKPKRPTIFISTHEFREDIEAAFYAAGVPLYIVNGSVKVIMNSFDGILNWIGGLIDGNKNLSEGFCRQIAKRGYLVCSLEYRLIPSVRVYEQFDDVCAGMDCIGRKLVDFDVDFTRIYLVAESAGAYLATYVAAMKKSRVLQDAIGYKPTHMTFKAMGLISGMFYTTRRDSLGWFLSRSIYGKDERSKAMAEYTNPEHPEIIYNIPPCYLITSKADMLERYTLDFAGTLGNKGVEHFLRHMGSDPKLIHAFPVLRLDFSESERVIDEIIGWFRKHEK